MDEREISCCFTGHRLQRLPWLRDESDSRTQALQQAVWERITAAYSQGYTRFYCGMAQGSDLLCARMVLLLRRTEPEVKLIPAVPYPAQAARWGWEERQQYREILNLCREETVVVCPAYLPGCFMARNHYMVDHSSRIIGIYDGSPQGGTFQTLEYARKKKLSMELIVPE